MFALEPAKTFTIGEGNRISWMNGRGISGNFHWRSWLCCSLCRRPGTRRSLGRWTTFLRSVGLCSVVMRGTRWFWGCARLRFFCAQYFLNWGTCLLLSCSGWRGSGDYPFFTWWESHLRFVSPGSWRWTTGTGRWLGSWTTFLRSVSLCSIVMRWSICRRRIWARMRLRFVCNRGGLFLFYAWWGSHTRWGKCLKRWPFIFIKRQWRVGNWRGPIGGLVIR